MDTRTALRVAGALVQPFARSTNVIEPDRLDASIASGNLLDAVGALCSARWGYLAAITGLDQPADARVEVLYHFCEGGAVATLRVSVPYDSSEIPSITGLVPYAQLYEVEVSEMFGVTVQGVPPQHLLLPEDWPAGVYPLRKSFTGGRPEPPPAGS